MKEFTSFAELFSELRHRVNEIELSLVSAAQKEMDQIPGFSETQRDGKKIPLNFYRTHKIENGVVTVNIHGDEDDIQILKEDEVGVGSKKIAPKANFLKLKNSILEYAKKNLNASEKL